jgi:hypothetical protein
MCSRLEVGAAMDLGATAVNDGFKLLVGLAFLPVLFGLGRQIRLPGPARPFLIGITALLASFAINFLFRQLGMNTVQWVRWLRHLAVAVSGFAFAWAAWRLRQHEDVVSGGQR